METNKPKTKYEGDAFQMEGQEWIVPSLSTADFRKYYSVLIDTDITIENLGEKLTGYLAAVHAALKRNYPDLTEDQLANSVEPGQLWELVKIVGKRSGLRPSKPGE